MCTKSYFLLKVVEKKLAYFHYCDNILSWRQEHKNTRFLQKTQVFPENAQNTSNLDTYTYTYIMKEGFYENNKRRYP